MRTSDNLYLLWGVLILFALLVGLHEKGVRPSTVVMGLALCVHTIGWTLRKERKP